VNTLWNSYALAEAAATAGSAAFNTGYFGTRGARTGGPRRLAALVLALLFGGVALEAAQGAALAMAGDESGAAALARLPLLVSSLATSASISLGTGR